MWCEILFDKIIHIDVKYKHIISYCGIILYVIYTSSTGIQWEMVFHFQEISKWIYEQIHQDKHIHINDMSYIIFF